MGRKTKAIGLGIPLTLVAFVIYSVASYDFAAGEKLNGMDGLFETSATLLAFSSLGSVLGARFSSDKNIGSAQFGMLAFILICGSVVIVLQAWVIVGLCCFELYANTYVVVMGVTVFCFITTAFIVLMFVYMNKDEDKLKVEKDKSQPKKSGLDSE